MSYEQGGYGDYDGRTLGSDAQFLMRYVQEAGDQAWGLREMVAAGRKPDLTVVTTADLLNHRLFVRNARRKYGPKVPIHSEEGMHLNPTDYPLVVVADTLDGSGEYGATHRDPVTGRFIGQGELIPPGAIPIEDSERSSCVAAAVFRDGIMWSAAVYAPYSDELLVADRDLGGTYRNGHRLDLAANPVAQRASFGPGIPYDFASWRGSLLDPRHLRRDLGRPPNGTYSAVMQARDVLTLRSLTSIFTGSTLHDLVPVLMAELAHAAVSDLDGNPINWSNLRGAVYSVNPGVHAGTIAAINAPRIDGLPPGYRPVGKGEVSAEEVVELRGLSAFGTEQRLNIWQDALDGAYAFVGAREIRTGRLVLASFLTGTARHGTMHDLVVHPTHRRQGLASYAIDKRVELARNYAAGGERVGMSYLEVDLGITALGVTVPLQDSFNSHGFALNRGALIRDYRHDGPA